MVEKMKNVSLIVNVVLVIAVAVLFVLVLSGRSSKGADSALNQDGMSVDSGIVYINTDSLIIKYDFARYLSEELIKKEEASRTDFNEKARVFQQDMAEFQRKVQNNGFLSLERAQNEERRLRQKEVELQDLNSRLSNELMEQQGVMNKQLRDTITSFLKEYCVDKPYKLVLSNTMGDNVLHAEEGLDITEDVVGQLNNRYAKSKK